MPKTIVSISRSTTLGLVIFAASALSACVGNDFAVDNNYRPYAGSDAYPITVAKGPVTLEVSSTHGTLAPSQINAVVGFAHQAMSAGVTPITVRRPSGGGASARVASEIASLMAQQGISRQMLRMTSYPAGASAPVQITYVSTHASTKPCGQWPEDLGDTESNGHIASHGCAVQANIAAMIVNPETLVVPASADQINSDSRTRAIRTLEAPTSRSSAFTLF
jgi:pilus assembly protein CpaD